jgi:hypothetical protein
MSFMSTSAQPVRPGLKNNITMQISGMASVKEECSTIQKVRDIFYPAKHSPKLVEIINIHYTIYRDNSSLSFVLRKRGQIRF